MLVAAEGIGFLYVRNQGVPQDLIARVAAMARAFFVAPFAAKAARCTPTTTSSPSSTRTTLGAYRCGARARNGSPRIRFPERWS